MKIFPFLFLTILLVNSITLGQITLSIEEYQHLYFDGHTLTYSIDTLKSESDLGSLGNNTWDFSNLLLNNQFTAISVSPFYSPFIDEFPEANYVTEATIDFMNSATNLYSYINLTENGFHILGSKIQTSIQGTIFAEKITYNPPQRSVIFPLSYLTEWVDTFEVKSTTLLNDTIISLNSEVQRIHYKCDAYGMIKTPQNVLLPALRIKADKTTFNITTGNYNKEINYKYITPDGFSVSFSAIDTLAPNTGCIKIKNLVWTYLGFVNVNSEEQSPSAYTLEQNYPNPFNPLTKIKFCIPKQTNVNLTIYDILGNKIKTILNEELSPGTYSTAWTPDNSTASGIYFCKLIANDFSKSVKMIYIK